MLRAGLLRALHVGHPGVLGMVLRAKENFWWPCLKDDLVQVRPACQLCHQNAPSQPKEPSRGVPLTQYAYESISMDHFFLKENEFLAVVDRHSGMLSVHANSFKGARELLRILRLHCQKNGIPREIFSDGSSIFMAHEVQEFFRRYNINHRVI